MNTDDIALIVDEPIAGHFYWILQQLRGDGSPRAVDAAPGPMPTYGSALMAGIGALQRSTQAAGSPFDMPVVHALRPGRSGPSALGARRFIEGVAMALRGPATGHAGRKPLWP